MPFITGQYTATAGAVANPFQTIERKDVGTTLRVRPQVSEGGAVKMQIFQEVSSVQDASLAAGLITNRRAIESNVLVDDGQIVVLGGLIQDSVEGNVSKVPLLGDIPGLGRLFRYDSRTAQEDQPAGVPASDRDPRRRQCLGRDRQPLRLHPVDEQRTRSLPHLPPLPDYKMPDLQDMPPRPGTPGAPTPPRSPASLTPGLAEIFGSDQSRRRAAARRRTRCRGRSRTCRASTAAGRARSRSTAPPGPPQPPASRGRTKAAPQRFTPPAASSDERARAVLRRDPQFPGAAGNIQHHGNHLPLPLRALRVRARRTRC